MGPELHIVWDFDENTTRSCSFFEDYNVNFRLTLCQDSWKSDGDTVWYVVCHYPKSSLLSNYKEYIYP